MNFYPLKDQFESLASLIDKNNIQLFLEEIQIYTKNLSPKQRQKQIQILMSKDILYYVIFLYTSKKQSSYLPYALYNICAADYNQYDGDDGWSLNPNATKQDLKRYEEIKKINNNIEDLSNNKKFFKKTFEIFEKIKINKYEISINFLFLKNNAIIHPHNHNKGSFAFHILLEDLKQNEECFVNVNQEKMYLKNSGDHFLFNTYHTHTFSYKGNGNKLLGFCITPDE